MSKWSLCGLWFSLAPRIISAAATTTSIRLDDVVVFDGETLVIDPVGGFNQTTSDKDWQSEYLREMDHEEVRHQIKAIAGHDAKVDFQVRSTSVDNDKRGALHKRSAASDCVCVLDHSLYIPC